MHPITLTSPGPIALKLGPLTVRWYGLIIAVGFLTAAWLAGKLAQRRGIDVDALLNACLIVFIGGIIGARLWFVLLSWHSFAAHPAEIFQVWLGGLSIHGGIIGGTIAGYAYARKVKLPFLEGCDIAGSVVPLAQAIGRWGNFFNSEAFGRPVTPDFPIAVNIPPTQRPPGMENDALFQPTFLYESIWDLAIFFLLYFGLFDRLKKYPGVNFLCYIFLYSLGRAVIEPLRTDSIMVSGFAAPSVVSLVMLAVALVGIVLLVNYYRHKQASGPKEVGLDKDQSNDGREEQK